MTASGNRIQSRRQGFTLFEVMVVVTVTALLAASAIPAMNGIRDSQSVAAAAETARQLLTARARAVSTGRPHGVSVSVTGTLGKARIEDGTVATVVGADGQDEPPTSLPAMFGGAEVESFLNGDGTTGSGTIWFDSEGTPHCRSSGGAFLQGFSQNAVVALTGGHVVTVHKVSGLVE